MGLFDSNVSITSIPWVEDGRLEEKTKKFYRNGWRLLKATSVAGLRVNQITGDVATIEISRLCRECQLRFADVATNALQSGGVEDDRSHSENQDDEGAWPGIFGLTMKQKRDSSGSLGLQVASANA
jgi:hypothetical protein